MQSLTCNPNGIFVVVCGDEKNIIYITLAQKSFEFA